MFIEPSDLVISCPELAGFVDVDLARLLGIGFPELLPDFQGPETGFEDPSLATEIGGARQTECACQMYFRFVQHVAIGITAQVERIRTTPVRFQALGVTLGQSRCGRSKIR